MIEHKPLLCRAIFLNRLAFIFFLALASAKSVSAQKKLTVKKAEMAFTSNAELELIKASSDKVQGLIDPATNQFAFFVDVKSFRGFNSELQREHFNEKYMESEKFPKARFSGKIIEPIDFSADQSYDVRAKGELDIHGQKQTRIIKSKVTIKDGQVFLETSFFVPLADHNITIPTIVSQKIAMEIEVTFKATMSGQ
jgi:polyisoprenoid-binding protein YceI